MVVRLFIAGPGPASGGTGDAFAEARAALEAAGYDAETGFYTFTGPWEVPDWFDLTGHDLAGCDGVAVLDGASGSPGTLRELAYAEAHGMPCRSVHWWVRHRGSSAICDCEDDALPA